MAPGADRESVISLQTPRKVEDTGLDSTMLVDLAIKTLLVRGASRLDAMARSLTLPPSVLNEVMVFIRAERLVEVLKREGFDTDAVFQLTEQGRIHARHVFDRCQYVGPTPVTLDAYAAVIAAYATQCTTLTASYVRRAFDGLSIDPAVVDEIGAAMNSRRAILVYGPAGSGKTFLAEHLASLLPGDIPVPHAITVGGEIAQVFDAHIHQPVPEESPVSGLVRSSWDSRWVRCRRPVVIAGGELTLQMLDLQFDPATGYYQAPPHMKANGGLFVVDDLGRQLVAARELMNRWIVPLDRQRDYLTLHTGFKFTVPFAMTLVFSTNLRPDQLADEAFLRRFGYKIYLGAMDRTSYRDIFRRYCAETGTEYDEEAFEWLLAERHQREGRALLACYPRDLVGRVRDFALYTGEPPRLSRESLARAWSSYFSDFDHAELLEVQQSGATLKQREHAYER